MKIAQRNKALIIYRFILVNVDNAKTRRSDEKSKKNLPELQVSTNERPQKSPKPRKRQMVDLSFHFLGMMAGFELAMVFTNWTTIGDNSFTSVDIIDNETMWVRFGGSVAGLVYIGVTALSSYIGARKRALRAMRRNRNG